MKSSNPIRVSQSLAMPFVALLFATACATTTPIELTNARVAYGRASAGPAAQLTPVDLHKAKTALDQAEQSFSEEKDSQKTIDLAYIAERTAQIAEAHAQTAIAAQKVAKAKQDYGDQQKEIASKTRGDLATTREQLSDAEKGQAVEAQQAGQERTARQDADNKAAVSEQKATASEKKATASEQKATASEQKANEANEALAKLAAKEEARGLVITLSGSVLFRSNDAALLPAAQARLDQVAEALVAKGQDVVIEGYTDSRGSQSTNMSLSQRRADTVRTYLVWRGFPAEKILARGMGPDRPIADNTSTEGRANNRRVEIVIGKTRSQTN